jgi:hypothetical protein
LTYAKFSGGGFDAGVGEEHGFSGGIGRIGETTTSEIGIIAEETKAVSATRSPNSDAGDCYSGGYSDQVTASLPDFWTERSH